MFDWTAVSWGAVGTLFMFLIFVSALIVAGFQSKYQSWKKSLKRSAPAVLGIFTLIFVCFVLIPASKPLTFSWDAVHWNAVQGFGALVLAASGVVLLSRQWRLFAGGLFGFIALLGTVILIEAYGPWQQAAEGQYDHAVYGVTEHAMLPLPPATLHETIVYFTDGSTRHLDGAIAVPFPKGTPIRILEKNGFYKIEPAKASPR